MATVHTLAFEEYKSIGNTALWSFCVGEKENKSGNNYCVEQSPVRALSLSSQ